MSSIGQPNNPENTSGLSPEDRALYDRARGKPAPQSEIPPLSPQDQASYTAARGKNAVEQPSLWEDVKNSATSALQSGIAGLPGMVGSMGQLYDTTTSLPGYGIAKIAEMTGQLPKGETASHMMQTLREAQLKDPTISEAEKRGYVNKIAGLPVITSAGTKEMAKRANVPYLTQSVGYEPKTPAGSVIKSAGEAAIDAAAMGPQKAISNAFLGLSMGTAGEGTRQFLKNKEGYKDDADTYAFIASLLAGLPMAGYQLVRHMSSSPEAEKRALMIAGQAQREAHPDPEAAAAKLAQDIAEQKAGKFLPGVTPSTAQLTKSPAAAGLEAKAKQTGIPTSSPEIAKLQAKQALSEEARAVGAQDVLGEAEGGEGEVGLDAAGDDAVAAEGGDAAEDDRLGDAVDGEVAGDLNADLSLERDHLGNAFNLGGDEFGGGELVGFEGAGADVAVALVLVALELAEVGGELG